MTAYLCFSVRFLHPYYHGRCDNDQPEWPPSPLRLFQALVAASAGHWNERTRLQTAEPALRWLEAQNSPQIVAPRAIAAERPYRLYVPDNVTDKVAASWVRARDGDVADYRTEKDVRPTYLQCEAVHYVYRLRSADCPYLEVLTAAAHSITHLGWGIDMCVADANVVSTDTLATLGHARWRRVPHGGVALRLPLPGTFDELIRRHDAFRNRLSPEAFRPVPPLKRFDVARYALAAEPLQRPFCVFQLRGRDGSLFRYPQGKLIHIAAMVRHLAIRTMQASPPSGTPSDWVEQYVAGHAAADDCSHRQFSYVPLPSIGHLHVDPAVRRIMIVAPLGDEPWLQHLARHLAGQTLEPLRGHEFAGREPPMLVPVKYDNIAQIYTHSANAWATVTPVILPGHDDHNPEKTCKLIEKALLQAGIEQPCHYEWSAVSRFPKSFSAHKYDKQGHRTGYIRPDHLQTQTAVHLTLRFDNALCIPGPLVLGAGRHCGFGLLAPCD